MKPELLAQLLKDQEAKRPVALATDLASGEQTLVYPADAANAADAADAVGDMAGDEAVIEAARGAIANDESGTAALARGDVFIHVYNPSLRFIIVGAVHIAQPLARMAALANYDVTVVDPRGSFATDDRFPGVTLKDGWPDEAMEALDPDRRTAVVTLTHDPKLDDPALSVAIRSEAFYIGALGSRKTHAKRVERLKEVGFTDTEIERIHGPVGLNIGGRSPGEIAVSILAQVTTVLHGRETA